VAIQSFLKAGFLSAVQLELLFMIGCLQPVTNEIGAPSFRNVSKHAFNREFVQLDAEEAEERYRLQKRDAAGHQRLEFCSEPRFDALA
jgi:hypothetical protein